MENLNCPICQTKITAPTAQIQDHISKEYFNLASCPSCHFEFIVNVPNNLTPYYENEMGSEMRKSGTSIFSKLRQTLLRADVKKPLNCLKNQEHILEIGCGPGDLASYINTIHPHISCADVFPKEQWKLDINYHQINIDDPDDIKKLLSQIKPKLIIMRHVLEHVKDPSRLVQIFEECCVEWVLIIVPNHQSVLKKFLGDFWAYWDPPRHLSFFSHHNLKLLFKQKSYKVNSCKVYGLDELAVSMNRFLRLKKIMNSLLLKLFSPKGILTALFSALSYPFLNSVLWYHFRLSPRLE